MILTICLVIASIVAAVFGYMLGFRVGRWYAVSRIDEMVKSDRIRVVPGSRPWGEP